MASGARTIPRAPVVLRAVMTRVLQARKEANLVTDSPGRYRVILQDWADVGNPLLSFSISSKAQLF